ncbi:MAG: CysB family HTH-type transcriptional regulator [Ectothiorhodospiraceae bacterium]|nr:CysB family HTH-type transcriptional regulator [Ectothiorhodospiraceae bacterium]
MKLHQLRCICEVVDHQLNVTDAATAMFTSQPGVSKQIRLLESELGVPIFAREGKRLTAITEPGSEIIRAARRMLREAENIGRIGADFNDQTRGTLTLATTHTQARYVLPPVIQQFRHRFPDVFLQIRQGNPKQICEMALRGEADIVIATEAVSASDGLIALACYRWHHCVLVPPGHPLLDKTDALTLQDLADHPIVTYDFAFAGRSQLNDAFMNAGLQPKIVLTALDADVIKTYVGLGLGIGLVADVAFDAKRDADLRRINISQLFPASTTWVGIRRGSYLRRYIFDFVELFAPHLSRATLRAALNIE